MRSRLLLLGALALGLWCANARATVIEDPATVKLVGTRPVAARGVPVHLTFEIAAKEGLEVTDVAVEGEGWSGRVADDRGSRFGVASGRPERFTVDAQPGDDAQPLVLRWTINGHAYRQSFDLSPRTAEFRQHGRPVVAAGPAEVPVTPQVRALRVVEPRGLAVTGERLAETAPPRLTAKSVTTRTLHVTGQFVFLREGINSSTDAWMGADGLTVQVMDQSFMSSGTDLEIGRATTDAFGNFDVTCYWEDGLEANPDIFVLLSTCDGRFLITPPGDDQPYYWRTATAWNVTGTSLALGSLKPGGEWDYSLLNVMTVLVRDWRWYLTQHGFDLNAVDVHFPINHSPVSHYSWDEQRIDFRQESAGNEETIGHEYGHHFYAWHLPSPGPEYCNNVCSCSLPCPEGTPDPCDHCKWCAEEPGTAWREAVPTWLAGVQARTFKATYGVAALYGSGEEWLQRCGGELADPLADEGHAEAFLVDVVDENNDDDVNGLTGGVDELTMTEADVWNVLFTYVPANLHSFAIVLLAAHPSLAEQIWATAANNRVGLDPEPPGVVTNLRCISHTAGVASGDATPTFQWDPAPDNIAGVDGYSYTFGTTLTAPDAVSAELGDVTTVTLAVKPPGRYTFAIRARDRAGNWSPDYVSWGEVVIREATPANLQPYDYPGWAHSVVPRATADASFLSVLAPTAPLPGNSTSTYWNGCGKNVGETSTVDGWRMEVYLDGTALGGSDRSSTGAASSSMATNQGPVGARGGRHALTMRVDDYEAIAESGETDNAAGKQWIWSPYTVASGTGVTRAAPPDRTGGWDDIDDGVPSYNCDGLRVTNGAGSYWRALWMRVDNASADYDCRLHFATPAADTGFGAYRAYSRRGAGLLDAVLYCNMNTGPVSQWDVGVLNASGSTSTYYAKLVSASNVYSGDSVAISFPAGEMLRLREFELAAADTGWYTAKLRVTSGTGPFTLAWYDCDIQTTALIDATASDVASDTADVAMLDVHLGRNGVYGLAMYRDPMDGTAAASVVLEFGPTRPDYAPDAPPGWHSALVPRPAADGTAHYVYLPDTLYGDLASTYINLSIGNEAAGTAGSSVYNRVFVDGVSRIGTTLVEPQPWQRTTSNRETASTIAGGRHTLDLRVDPFAALEERVEDNNGWGEQWVWGPALLGTAGLTRSAPPDPMGGFDQVTSSPYGVYFNCDGLRVDAWSPSSHSYYWGAYAVMPGDTSDVDVRLHEIAPGTQTGFRSNLVRSTWGAGGSDYVLVNFNRTAFRGFDVGVLRAGSGTQSYTAQLAKSIFRATNPNGTFGPYTLTAGSILTMHEFRLDAGVWDVTLENVSGTVDWGLSVHDGGRTYHTKTSTMLRGIAWEHTAGMREQLRITADSAGYYAVVVWKVGPADLPLAGTYTLTVSPSATDVPRADVWRTAFTGARPSPFRNEALLSFELARAGDVSLEVYDLTGARRATLASGPWPAGRHDVRWSDASGGRDVPPGIYFVRFEAGGVVETRRLVKLD